MLAYFIELVKGIAICCELIVVLLLYLSVKSRSQGFPSMVQWVSKKMVSSVYIYFISVHLGDAYQRLVHLLSDTFFCPNIYKQVFFYVLRLIYYGCFIFLFNEKMFYLIYI